jgi:hypothetical protein
MSGVLSAETVERSFSFVRPAIEAVFKTGVTGRSHLAVVVTAVEAITGGRQDGKIAFADSCYLVTSLGDLSSSPWPNMQIALKKAQISARTGMPTSQLPPTYLREGDTVFHGSAVLGGIVVACAGLDPRHDEMFSWWIASAVLAQTQIDFAGALESRPDASFWSGRL